MAIKHPAAGKHSKRDWVYETRCKLPRGLTWMVGFKDGFFWFEKWYCCFGKYPAKHACQFNLPKGTAWWTLQAGSQESIARLCSWAPLTAAVIVQGSLRLLLPHKTGVQVVGRNSRIWAESDCCPSRVTMPRRDRAEFTLFSEQWQSLH